MTLTVASVQVNLSTGAPPQEGLEEIYPVHTAASLLGLSEVRVYQLVRAAASDPLPPSGLYLRPVPAEALLDYGINLSITPKPKCWIPASEIARYKALRGK